MILESDRIFIINLVCGMERELKRWREGGKERGGGGGGGGDEEAGEK